MTPDPSLEALIRIQNWIRLFFVISGILSATAGVASYVLGVRIDALRGARERILREEVQATRERLEPRQLTTDQAETLVRALRGKPQGWVFVEAVVGDPEALELAQQLSEVLRSVGWRVEGPDFRAGVYARGIYLLVADSSHPPPAMDELVAAFDAARIPLEREVSAFRPDALRLLVGHKP